MSRVFICDQCDTRQDMATFEVCQLTDELDEDGDQITVLLHLCSAQCLADFAMGMTLDFPEEPE